jgi:MYXO-CTERM domain-containing protein
VVEDGGVPPADGGVDGAPTDTGADEGSEGGAVADAGTDAGPPAADAAADAVPDDAGNGGESGGHHHWPPHRWGCSVAPSDSALAPWATLLFALVIAKVRRRGASAAANAPRSVA